MSEKILIFGNGQIGNFYHRYFTQKGIDTKIAVDADITVFDQVLKAITDYQPTVVINTAAITNLEQCSQNRLEAFNVNVLGADNVAQACDQKNVYFIHFSSGCIFESKDEFDAKKVDDLPSPAAFYSWTKVWSENLVKFKKSPKFQYLILRPRQPISSEIDTKNMLIKFLTFTKFVDTPNTGTVIEDLMDWTLALIKIRHTGTIHVANEGWSTPYRISQLLKKYILPELPTEKITKAELDKLTPNRRVDTILDVTPLKSITSVVVKPFEERLEEIIIQLAKNFKAADPALVKSVMESTAETSKQRTVINSCWQTLIK